MSRAARQPLDDSQLERMSLDELNAAISHLETRILVCGRSQAANGFRAQRDNLQRMRLKRFGK